MAAALKVMGMVALVVLPGGSLVLLAAAVYRAYKQRTWPFSRESMRAAADRGARVVRWFRIPFVPAAHRA